MQKPKELKVMILDNGAFHKAKRLIVPNNIILIFIPPYSPELNPAEKIWWKYKRAFTNKFFKSLDQVSDFISSQVISLSAENVKSICRFEYFFSSNYWTIL
jgi:transposase